MNPAESESLLRDFERLLTRERDALIEGDSAAVEAAAGEKAEAIARFLAARVGWPGRREVVARLAEMNAQNGRLIAWRLARLGERLMALGALAPEGNTYDALGSLRGRISRGPGAMGCD